MNKKLYLTLLTIVTTVCIIGGSIYHIVGWGVSFAERLIPFAADSDYSASHWSADLKADQSPQDALDSQSPSASTDTQNSVDDSVSFTSIFVDAHVMSLEIVPGERAGLSFRGTSSLEPKYEVKNGVLVITQKKPLHTNSLFGNRKCSVTLTVPSGVCFDSIDIRSAVGDIDLSGLQAQKVYLETPVGDIDIDSCEFEEVMIDASVGDVDMDDCEFLRLTIDASVGDIDVDGTPDLSDYTIDLKTSVGEVSFNDGDYKRSFSQTGAEDKYIKISNSTGDVSVDE